MAQALRQMSHQVLELPEGAGAGLPPPGTRHWVPRHKAAVVAAVDAGALSLGDARRDYLLSEEELDSWRETIDRYGVVGLGMSVSERRGMPRVPVNEPAVAALNADQRVDCRITDVSDRGARVELQAKVRLPQLFELICASNERSWWVDLVWQRGDAAGLRFTNPLPAPWEIQTGLGLWLVGKDDTVAIDRMD